MRESGQKKQREKLHKKAGETGRTCAAFLWQYRRG